MRYRQRYAPYLSCCQNADKDPGTTSAVLTGWTEMACLVSLRRLLFPYLTGRDSGRQPEHRSGKASRIAFRARLPCGETMYKSQAGRCPAGYVSFAFLSGGPSHSFYLSPGPIRSGPWRKRPPGPKWRQVLSSARLSDFFMSSESRLTKNSNHLAWARMPCIAT